MFLFVIGAIRALILIVDVCAIMPNRVFAKVDVFIHFASVALFPNEFNMAYKDLIHIQPKNLRNILNTNSVLRFKIEKQIISLNNPFLKNICYIWF